MTTATLRHRDTRERALCLAVTPLCVGVVLGLWLAGQLEDLARRLWP